MKSKLVVIITIICMAFAGCASSKQINGKWYDTEGLATLDNKDECVHYEFVVGNLIWSIILLETIIMPVYFLGWSIYEPIGEKSNGCFQKREKTAN